MSHAQNRSFPQRNRPPDNYQSGVAVDGRRAVGPAKSLRLVRTRLEAWHCGHFPRCRRWSPGWRRHGEPATRRCVRDAGQPTPKCVPPPKRASKYLAPHLSRALMGRGSPLERTGTAGRLVAKRGRREPGNQRGLREWCDAKIPRAAAEARIAQAVVASSPPAVAVTLDRRRRSPGGSDHVQMDKDIALRPRQVTDLGMTADLDGTGRGTRFGQFRNRAYAPMPPDRTCAERYQRASPAGPASLRTN